MARRQVKDPSKFKKSASGGKRKVAVRGRSTKKWVVPLVVAILLVLTIQILFVRQMPSAADFKVNPVFAFNASQKGSGPVGAWDVAAVGNDRVAVADQPSGRIVLFDRGGNLIKAWGKKGEKGDTFKEPSGIIADATGNIWVVDAWRSSIRGFTQEGKEIATIPLKDRFYGPRGVAAASANVFYVADTGSHRVVRVSSSGSVDASWGESRGPGRDSVDNPRSLCVDAKGIVYVADYENKRIQVLDPNKKTFVRQIKCDCKPADVAIDAKGRLYVPCVEDGFVKVFNSSNGRGLGSMVDPAGSPAPFTGKSGIDVAPDGTVILGGGDNISGWKPAS